LEREFSNVKNSDESETLAQDKRALEEEVASLKENIQ
jgi:hypothetical protein